MLYKQYQASQLFKKKTHFNSQQLLFSELEYERLSLYGKFFLIVHYILTALENSPEWSSVYHNLDIS